MPQIQLENVDYSCNDVEDNDVNVVNNQLFVDNGLTCCDHGISSLPMIYLTFGENKYCAILDSGAQTSLVSSAAIDEISKEISVEVLHGHICDIMGFSGDQSAVARSIELPVSIASTKMKDSFKFAVVEESTLPHCFLLGLDFMGTYNIGIDFKRELL